MTDRFFASIFVGLLAHMIALSAGIVGWRDWPVGDAFDFGMSAAFATWFLLSCLKIHVTINNIPARRIEAQSDETLQAARPEGREPGPKDAPNE